MRVLGVGLSKTGTTSLHRGLGILGLRSLHYDDTRLRDVIDGSNPSPDFRRYDDLDAVLDIPAACFYEELLKAYPECKCILTVRDEDAWWKSVRTHFNQRAPVTSLEQDPFKWRLRNYVYGSATAHEFLYRKRYREHNEEVVRKIPSKRLLIMDVTAGDGWEKLCPFLDVEIPSTPFPHQNQRGESSPGYRDRTKREIAGAVAPGDVFILVDEQFFWDEAFPERQAIPFTERHGEYWGRPADDEAAIGELERLRRAGATHMIFAWPAFWWLDHYTRFNRYLRSHFRCVVESDRLIAFELRSLES